MARPLLDIDPKQVEQLAMIQCSYDEMAAVLDCDPKTLSNRFSQAIKKGREQGKSSLKRAQYKSAMDGNSTMLIWLGKQHLDQKDEHHIQSEHKDEKQINIKFDGFTAQDLREIIDASRKRIIQTASVGVNQIGSTVDKD